MATKRMDENWRILRDRIKHVWPDVEFDDKNMKKTRGSLPQMVTLVHEHTGESRADIRQKIMAVM